MKYSELSPANFWEKVKKAEPVITKTKKYFYTYARNNRTIFMFPVAYTENNSKTTIYEVVDDIIIVDTKSKTFFDNKDDPYTKKLIKVLEEDGFIKAKIICDQCPREDKCAHFIKESLKQFIEQAPCLTEEEEKKDPDKRVTIWYDQIVYKVLEEEIKAVYFKYKEKEK